MAAIVPIHQSSWGRPSPLNSASQSRSRKALGSRLMRRVFPGMSCSWREDSPCHFAEHSTSQVHSLGIDHTCQGNPLAFSGPWESFQVDGKVSLMRLFTSQRRVRSLVWAVLPSGSLRPLHPCHVPCPPHSCEPPCPGGHEVRSWERPKGLTHEVGAPVSSSPWKSRGENAPEVKQTPDPGPTVFTCSPPYLPS